MTRFKDLINGNKTVLADFYAEWCGPCKTMTPILEQVKKLVGDQATIIKIDVDKNPAAADQYQIRGVPTLMIFKRGEVKWRQSGVVPADRLMHLIESNS